GRLPVGIVCRQAPGIESGFVVPKKFPLRPVWPIFFLDDFVESGERVLAVAQFLQTNSFFEKRLVPPMDGRIFLGGELIVNRDRAPVILAIGLAGFIEDVALAAERLAFFLRL